MCFCDNVREISTIVIHRYLPKWFTERGGKKVYSFVSDLADVPTFVLCNLTLADICCSGGTPVRYTFAVYCQIVYLPFYLNQRLGKTNVSQMLGEVAVFIFVLVHKCRRLNHCLPLLSKNFPNCHF